MENILHPKHQKNICKYECLICDFKCCKKGDYSRHILTVKHKREIKKNNIMLNNIEYTCKKCFKQYNSCSGLWKHNQKCNVNSIDNDKKKDTEENIKEENIKEDMKNLTNLVLKVIEQNQDLTKQIIEISKEKTITNNNNNTNCNNNNKFNLNFFLNETCKDALNMSEFISQLNIGLKDLENVGEFGFAEGISRSFINGLKALDVCKRPLHCSDIKRETLYIKDENKWEKEDDNRLILIKAIKQIAHKNVKNIPQWKNEHPNCSDIDDEYNDEYMQIVIEAMTCGSDEKTMNEYKKIIRNIAKEVVIEK